MLFYRRSATPLCTVYHLYLSSIIFLLSLKFPQITGLVATPDAKDSTLTDHQNRLALDYESLMNSFPDGNNTSNSSRLKKELPRDKVTNQVLLLFEDETMSDIDNFETSDIIIRLQEKYEYTECTTYLRSIPSVENKYFQFESSLLEPDEGDEEYTKLKDDRKKTTYNRRFRLYGEGCNENNENKFWQELFKVAANDTVKYAKNGIPGQTNLGPEDYSYLQLSKAKTMEEWNKVWTEFKSKGVCNQRLMLECIDETCVCRKDSIGRFAMYESEKDPDQFKKYVTRHYYTNLTLVRDEELRNYETGKQYKFSDRCVLTVIQDGNDDDGHVYPNSCDFFMPMIGLCRAECVENATCISADEDVKSSVEVKAQGKPLSVRIRTDKKHFSIHNRCHCPNNKICRQIDNDVKETAAQYQPWKIGVMLAWAMGLLLLTEKMR